MLLLLFISSLLFDHFDAASTNNSDHTHPKRKSHHMISTTGVQVCKQLPHVCVKLLGGVSLRSCFSETSARLDAHRKPDDAEVSTKTLFRETDIGKNKRRFASMEWKPRLQSTAVRITPKHNSDQGFFSRKLGFMSYLHYYCTLTIKHWHKECQKVKQTKAEK